MKNTGADAVVIGAGVMGCAIAFELAKRDWRVRVLDRGPAAGYGSTSSTSAIVRAHYSSRQGVLTAFESAQCWQDWSNYIGDCDERGVARLVPVGTLLLKGPDRHYTRVLPHYQDIGVPYHDLSAAELQRKLPILDVHSFWPPKRPADDDFWDEPSTYLDGAILTPWSGYIDDPQLATHNLQRAAQAAGAVFEFRTEVSAVTSQHGRVRTVQLTDARVLSTRVVVNATGPHSGRINQMAGAQHDMRITTRPLRHEVHHVPAPPAFDYEHHGYHVSDPDLGIDFRPETGNHISVGSEGPECDPKQWIDDPDVFDRRVSDAVWQPQVYRLARRLPSLRVPSKPKGVADLYDVTEDWIPIYDRSCVDGYYMAIGTSGNQFKNAPTVGYLMAELITACEAGYDHDKDALRVPARYLDFNLDLGQYSRLREPAVDSSLTAMG